MANNLDYISRYQSENIRSYRLKLNHKTEQSLIDWLESQNNVSGYIKSLVIKDMSERKNNMNEVVISANTNKKAAYPICTRVSTIDGWSVPEFFYSREEAEEYASKAPFSDKASEQEAFNAVRSETLMNMAEHWISLGQKSMAAHYMLKSRLYADAGTNFVSVDDEKRIDRIPDPEAIEKAGI